MMIEVRTPCRLHFGLLACGGEGRQFGGVGLMVRKPDIAVRVSPASAFSATGPMAEQAQAFAQRFAHRIVEEVGGAAPAGETAGLSLPGALPGALPGVLPGAMVQVVRAPRPHTGLGTGTQLGMAVGRALAELIGLNHLDAPTLAQLVGRGERSAIGAHGFFHGGLIVEGGKFDLTTLSPMLARQPVPEDWRIVLACPARLQGISGRRERDAFASMPRISEQATERMSRLVLLGLLPAVIERDLELFSDSLYELQVRVGECFAAAQGGVYADPFLSQIVEHIRRYGIRGVGQSSWGPTLYAVAADQDQAEHLAGELARRFDLGVGELTVTQADNRGATVASADVSRRAPRP